MGRSITIELPLPPKALHPNARGHSRYKPTAKPRRDAAFMARYGLQDAGLSWLVLCETNTHAFQRATWQAAFTFRTNRARDADNLVAWLKAYLDGAVTDARLLPGDDSRYLTMAAAPSIVIDKAAVEGVRLTFTEVVT